MLHMGCSRIAEEIIPKYGFRMNSLFAYEQSDLTILIYGEVNNLIRVTNSSGPNVFRRTEEKVQPGGSSSD